MAPLALAKTDDRQGCWLRAASDAGGPGQLMLSSGNAAIDDFCERERSQLDALFGVTPALRYFAGADSNNAFADNKSSDPNRPSGTVLIGIDLAVELLEKYKPSSGLPLAAVMAHEWGHIVQFSRAFRSEWDVDYELGADAGAGWYLLKTRGHRALQPYGNELGEFFATLGSRRFNNFRFHGSPTQRKYELLGAAGLLESDVPISDFENRTAAAALGLE